MTPRTAQRAILDALTERGGFCARPTLQQAVEGRGVSPRAFTKNVAKLVASREVQLVAISVPNYPAAKAFANRPLSDEDIADVQQLYSQRCEILETNKLGRVGQEYTRAIFMKARQLGASWYGTIKRKKSLGFLDLPGSRGYADLIISASLQGFAAPGLLIEVKNGFERFYPTRLLFQKLMGQAYTTGLQPALVSAHLSETAREFCEDVGIATLVLGRQIIASVDMRSLRGLYGRDVSERFQGFRRDRPFRGKLLLGAAEEHVRVISQREWLLNANQRWTRNAGIIPPLVAAMRERDWTTYKALRVVAHANALAISREAGDHVPPGGSHAAEELRHIVPPLSPAYCTGQSTPFYHVCETALHNA